MSVLRRILGQYGEGATQLETYGRQGNLIGKVRGEAFERAVERYRQAFRGWSVRSYCGHKVVGLLFRPEETIEFLVATFAAVAEGFTVVPFYPNWSSETQHLHLKQYGIRAMAVGDGYARRVEGWCGQLEHVIRISGSLDDYPEPVTAEPYPDVPGDHPCAWIFTSGTSGKIPKCTVISVRNIEAAVENIRQIDFLAEGMTLHSPLSTSHIFAFAVVLGMMAVRPSRLLFSDVQYLARLPEEKIGKVDGVILVPLVLNRMRSGFYGRLLETGPSADPRLARLPLVFRRFLKVCAQTAERSVIDIESGRLAGLLRWPSLAITRAFFRRRIPPRLGSPKFVVVGGAKPNLQSMAFLDVMGIRCLQGWGMTETTGALAVCSLEDRFSGAYGTCGGVFADTRAYVEDGELIVEGPQVAEGYIHPDGQFDAFNGVKRTGDCAEFDLQGRLKVLGKASDRITLENGMNYNPQTIEEKILALDLKSRHLLEDVVVIGEGQARFACVFFLLELSMAGAERRDPRSVVLPSHTEEYLLDLLRRVNSERAIDEQIGPWVVAPKPLRETAFLGPSGKIRRRLLEEEFRFAFDRTEIRRLERVTE